MSYIPKCGNTGPHDSHMAMDLHFKESWCGGLCGCGCTCADHGGFPHGPGDHK